jgi:hypothetical protein
MILYLIAQPVVGENERGDVDAVDDESLKSEFVDGIFSELRRLNKNIELFIIITYQIYFT